MKIEDLVGFGKVFEKFMDVCASGIGKVYEPRQIKKIADAKVYEIEKVTEALVESKKKLNSNLSYENGEVKVLVDKTEKEVEIENVEVIEEEPQKQLSTTPDLEFIEESSENIEKALNDREFYKNLKKDKNIYNTLNFTMNEFENVKEEEISEEKVDEDWISRYFDTIEDISNEHLQMLWAKILAGEIKKPNTYSLRTLELLKNLSFKEAELFSKIGNFSIQNLSKTSTFMISDKRILENLGINFNDILILQDLDLLNPNNLSFDIPKQDKDTHTFLFYGKELIKVELKKDIPFHLSIYSFTSIGRELLTLIERISNELYKQELAKEITKKTTMKVYSTPLLDEKGSHIPSLFKEIT